MAYLLCLCIIICNMWIVTGQLIPCDDRPMTAYPGPPVPKLPQQFQMHVEANIVQKNMTLNVKEYYDYPGNRGVLETYSRLNGEKVRTIMDFQNKEAWKVFANNTCRFLSTNSSGHGMLGLMSGKDGHIKTSQDLLYFGENLGEVYVGGNDVVRGIPTNHWRTCVKMPATNGTFTLDYYFTKTSGYFEDGLQLEIPVRAIINGTGKSMRNKTAGVHSFYHIYDFYDFKTGGVDNEEIFQVPPGVVCNQGYLNTTRARPVIPDQFSASMQKIIKNPEGNIIRNNYQLHVDNTSQLFRIDSFRPLHRMDVKLYGNTPLSYIYDYSNNLTYIIDKYAENCTVIASSPYSGQGLVIEAPAVVNDLFLDLSKFTYQGKKTLRNSPVLSWGYFNTTTKENIDILFSMVKDPQGKQMMNGPESGPILPHHAALLQPYGIYKWTPGKGDMKPSQTVEHLFDFTSGHVDPDIFDVSNCYVLGGHSIYLAVDVTGDYVSDIVKYHPKALMSKLRQVFASAAKVSPTRISSIKWEVLKSSDGSRDPFLMVTFVMFDNKLAGLHGTSLHGPSLSNAVVHLQNAWNAANSNINFNVHLEVGKSVTLSIRSGSLWQLQPQYPQSDVSGRTGYSSGSMAGLGIGMIILGAILGLLAAYVIYKRINTEVPYQVTN